MLLSCMIKSSHFDRINKILKINKLKKSLLVNLKILLIL
jgi:hypothetical protein